MSICIGCGETWDEPNHHCQQICDRLRKEYNHIKYASKCDFCKEQVRSMVESTDEFQIKLANGCGFLGTFLKWNRHIEKGCVEGEKDEHSSIED